MSATNTSHVTVRPSAVQQATNYNYLSTIDILKPQVLDEFIMNHGTEDFSGWMELFGQVKEVETGAQSFIHYETSGRLHQFITVGSVSAGTNTNDAAVVLDASSLVNGLSAVRVGQTVEFKDGSFGYVSAKSDQSHINIMPYATGQNLATFLTAGDPILLRWMEVGEGSDSVPALTPVPAKYTNNLIQMREDYQITDQAASAVSWVPVEMSDGTTGYYWYYKGENDTFRRFKNNRDFQKLFGKAATNSNVTAAGVKGSQSLIPAIKAGGNSIGYGSTMDITAFDVAVQVIDKEGGASESVWICDLRQAQASAKFLHDYNVNGGIRWGDFDINSDVAVQLGFSSFKYAEHTFHQKVWRGFNQEAVFGITNPSSPTLNYGVIMPLDFKDDPKRAGTKVPSMCVRYAPVFGQRMKHWTTGAGAVNANSSKLDLNFHYSANEALETFGINRFIEIGASL